MYGLVVMLSIPKLTKSKNIDDTYFLLFLGKSCVIKVYVSEISMEDGGVDRTVINCWQNHLGQMADFPPLLIFLTFLSGEGSEIGHICRWIVVKNCRWRGVG
jgi:hypothetical protein